MRITRKSPGRGPVTRREPHLCATVLCAVGLGSTGAALADGAEVDVPATAPVLSEIVVTAQKREERLQDVPVSVAAVQADTLVEQDLLSLKDYAARIPGLTVNTGTNRTSGIALRGVTTGGNGNPTVATLIDDIPFGGSGYAAYAPIPDLDPSDLAQVEVLRGPQGTLYGASNLGGLIKYVTKQANPNEFSGRVEVGGTDVSQGGSAGMARAAVNIPIVSDKVGLRVSGFYRRDPGYIDNTLINRDDVNYARYYGGRAALFLAPIDNLTVNIAVLDQHLERGELGFEELGPDYQPATATLGPGFTGRELTHATDTAGATTTQRLYSIRADYQLPFGTITSLTGYGQSRFDEIQDTTSRFSFLLPLFGLPADGRTPLTNLARTNKISEELRLASQAGGPIEWLVGGFYTKENSNLTQLLDVTENSAYLTNLAAFTGPNTYEEFAGFADVTYKVTSALDVQVGGRFARNEQFVEEDGSGPLNGGTTQTLGDSAENAFTWLVTPRYHLSDNNMVYVRVATGYRPGGPNTVLPGIPATFKSDSTIDYDLGFKGTLWDQRLSYDVAAYWIDWKDIQLSLTDNATQFAYFDNAGKARSRGLESSLSYELWQGGVVSGNLLWGDARLRDNLPSSTTVTGNYGLAGDRLPFTANLSGNLGFDQNWVVSNYRITAGASLSYVGERLGAFAVTQTVPRIVLPGFTTLDLRTGVKTANGFSVNVFARNVTDRRGWTYGELRSASSASQGYKVYVTQPRTVGLNVAWEFQGK